jgi:dTDP-4-dehydrorhamnose 3,5-epimerase
MERAKDFVPGLIEGIICRPLRAFHDSRGWLCELFRVDELPADRHPAMAYLSATLPGVTRGPHEHVEQTDCFGFIGPGNFEVIAWDNRPHSATYRHTWKDVVGADKPMLIVIPPGVVHAYTNRGDVPGLVFNAPNRLYRGPGRKEAVDEMRHEDDRDSPFRVLEKPPC